jgi:hypothetical protein
MNELDCAPSFEEFKRNREKYLGRDDEDFGIIDKGSQSIKRTVHRHIYEIEGYRVKTLEEVERIAINQGIPIRELDYRPQVVPLGGGKCDILVKFLPQKERTKRALW